MSSETMHTIWRYDLAIEDEVPLEVPAGAKFLPHVVASDRVSNGFTVWAEVNPGQKDRVERMLHVYGTGHPKQPGGEYLGTFEFGGNLFAGVGVLWFHVLLEES